MTTPDPIAALRKAAQTIDTYIIRCGDPIMGKPTWQEASRALDALRNAALYPAAPELRTLAEAVAPCCSWGYAGVACNDHLALRAALADTPEPQDALRLAAQAIKSEHDAEGHSEPCALCAALADTPEPLVDAFDRWRLVRVSTDLFAGEFGTRTDRGELLTAEWGEPDAAGVYDIVFTVHPEDRLLPSVEALAEALPQHRTCSDDVSGHESCLRIARKQWANLRRGS